MIQPQLQKGLGIFAESRMALGILLVVAIIATAQMHQGVWNFTKNHTEQLFLSCGVKRREFTNEIFMCLTLKCYVCNIGLIPGCGDPFTGSRIDGAYLEDCNDYKTAACGKTKKSGE